MPLPSHAAGPLRGGRSRVRRGGPIPLPAQAAALSRVAGVSRRPSALLSEGGHRGDARVPARSLGAWRRRSTRTRSPRRSSKDRDTAKRVYVACYDGTAGASRTHCFENCDAIRLGFGPATVSEPVVDAEADEICDRFLRSIGYSGICEIEMKRDSQRRPGEADRSQPAAYRRRRRRALRRRRRLLAALSRHDREAGDPRPGERKRFPARRASLRRRCHHRLPASRLISWRDVVRSYKRPLAFYDFDTPRLALFARYGLPHAARGGQGARPAGDAPTLTRCRLLHTTGISE